MPRRKQPWDHYRRVDYRLRRWSDWVLSQAPDRIGWNVYTGDCEPRLKVQLRNDTHSDPVQSEWSRLTEEERVIWSTSTALHELPRIWRRMLWLLYIESPGMAYQHMAEQLGLERKAVTSHLWHAFAELDQRLTLGQDCGIDSHSAEV